MSNVIAPVTDASFDQDVRLASRSRPVLVDFWAAWCGPCRMVAPLLEQLATEHGEQLRIVKLNVDENPATPAALGIRSIPTLMLFNNGERVATQVGASPKAQLAAFVAPFLAVA